MAWGTTGITEDELKRIAAVREYLYEHFPGASIRDSYDPSRLAQVFRIEVDDPKAIYTTVVSTEFLRDHPPSTSGTILADWRLADHLLAAKGADLVVTSWGIDAHER